MFITVCAAFQCSGAAIACRNGILSYIELNCKKTNRALLDRNALSAKEGGLGLVLS